MSALNDRSACRVTVVTVCRNAGALIEATSASVAAQSQSDYEWLVIDGASTDDTVLLAKRSQGRIAGRTRIVSEPDEGIYDAMNKGLRLARGEWVLFLNAGDAFADDQALEQMLNVATANAVMVNARIRLRDSRDGFTADIGEQFSWSGVALGKVPPHPACLYRREKISRHGVAYEPGFGLAADTVFTLRIATLGEAVFLPRVVAIFQLDGVSSRFEWSWRVHREKARAIGAVSPAWVGRMYRWRWPVEALRATAAHYLERIGLLSMWRRIKKTF